MTVTLLETGMIKVQFAEASTGLFAEWPDTGDREVGVAVQALTMWAPVSKIEQNGIEVVARGVAAAAAGAF